MNAETLSYLWVALLAFGLGWWCCRLKDVIDWTVTRARRRKWLDVEEGT